ncbi:MAG: hypothetical protein KDK07_17175 [Bauldia sp.]|nr:hypothetical protein [Bauldia sp.]
MGDRKKSPVRKNGAEAVDGVAYRHLLITRYNIVSGFAAAGGFDPLDPAWLEHREALFLRFCAPSVARQTVRDFEWVLLVHPATPERFREPLARHARLLPADNLNDGVDKLTRSIPDDDKLLVTSRVDNDDALAPDYIATARKAALRYRQGARSAASMAYGLRVDLESMRARGIHHTHCPFVTMVETVRPFRSVVWYPHNKIDNACPLTAVTTVRPMWLQTLHGRNVTNHTHWDAHVSGAIDAGLYADRFPGLEGTTPAQSHPRLRLVTMGLGAAGKGDNAGKSHGKGDKAGKSRGKGDKAGKSRGKSGTKPGTRGQGKKRRTARPSGSGAKVR